MKPIHNVIVKIKELFKWIKDGNHFTNLFLINKFKSVKPRRATRNNNASMKPKNYFLDSPIKNIRLVNLEFVGKIIDIDDTKVNSGISLLKLNISQVDLKASRVELSNSIDSIKIEFKEDLNRRLSNIVSDKLKSKE